jgi:HAD superfamily hydrolase (TIGR01548 family)
MKPSSQAGQPHERVSGPESDSTAASGTTSTLPVPDTLLFDLDGVLVDVTRSYRACIKATATFFGGKVTREEVGEAKRRGNANNDWILTRELLAERGIDVSLQQVIDVFQRFYVGTTESPGFRDREVLIVKPELLDVLRQQYALAIVTGRPGHEAARFLSHFGLASRFERVVAMDDAPAKPDPTGVRNVMRALESEVAWMLGDTPDDMRAAVGAGAIAIGICAAEDTAMRSALTDAGARVILENVNQIEELLP